MSDELRKGLVHSINIHGHAFQYAVLKTAERLFEENISPWVFEVAEFPVLNKDIPLHIDFILRNKYEQSYLIAECKRCDPAISNWCFIKAPYVSRKTSSGRERLVRELVFKRKISNSVSTSLQWISRSSDIYRLSFELKSNTKGEGYSGRGQINDAITQVLRGLNGMIEFAVNELSSGNSALFKESISGTKYVSYLPVIFTTAKLWVCDCDISEADIESGKANIDEAKLEERKWLFYQYAQSPALKHPYREELYGDMSDILYADYTRTIPIVNSEGIKEFLSDSIWIEPEDWQSSS
jgi:hypothetical protein